MPQGAEPMYDIHLPDVQTIIAAGRDGYILRSGDAGLNWKINRPADQHFRALDFSDALIGWAAGDNGIIFKTSNGGESWSALSVPGNFNFRDVDFADAQTGWACGVNGTILKTTKGGANWIIQTASGTSIASFKTIAMSEAQNVLIQRAQRPDFENIQWWKYLECHCPGTGFYWNHGHVCFRKQNRLHPFSLGWFSGNRQYSTDL